MIGASRGRGVLELRTASAEMYIPFVCCAEKLTYRRQRAVLLAIWRRENAVSIVHDLASFFSMKTGVDCTLSFNGGTEYVSTTSRYNFVRAIGYWLVCKIMRSFQFCRLAVVVCMRHCHLGGTRMNILIFCLF